MTEFSRHGEWLSLIDVSGPFLAEPVLKQVFPQGLERTDPLICKHVRQAYDEWREAVDTEDPQVAAIHGAWIDLVLKQILELDEDGEEDVLKPRSSLSESLTVSFPEREVTLRPDYAVVAPQIDSRPLMFVTVYPPEADLDAPVKGDGWAASRAERMVEICRACEVRLGLVTNGERWMLVDAPVGGITSFANWYARLWGQEPITLQAFVNLLGIRRFFVDDSERLPALLDESLKLQDEVTDTLGEQVRRAVEVLVQALDRADVDRNRELLTGVEPSELYEAALTVLMRIVFLLSAEERRLLPLDEQAYEAYYAVSTLRLQLRAESEEILERRQDAWSRLLAIFRAVYGGIEHEALKLPALGGSLFDPDRFPFLEGRAKGTNWKEQTAAPLPIDNRTVLLLLDAVQLFEGRTLSYRALDIEQIGYVYEGLLERTVVRASDATLDLNATKRAKTPWVTLDELETAAADGDNAVRALLGDRTGSSANRVENDLAKKIDDGATDRLLTACHGDQSLRDRITPYLRFLRVDRWGYPLVYPEGTFMVTVGADRRETGTHYTPKSLTEKIVKETLEPLVYVGPADGKPRKDWTLRHPSELLDLKICDPAMGSGAFLVQVCRWLSDRLVEAWAEAEAAGQAITADGEIVTEIAALEPLRSGAEDRVMTARRLIAERCLYGVDMNPLAVELAKLSIWLVTLAKARPFGFLDHNLRCGDSLLGIHDLDQLLCLDMTPGEGSSKKLFAATINAAVEHALELRAELRKRPIRDIRDIEFMASQDKRTRQELDVPQRIADAFIGDLLNSAGKVGTGALSIEAAQVIENPDQYMAPLVRRAQKSLQTDLPVDRLQRRPFHWPLEFPEVFRRDNGGFDALVSNPPFMGGRRISSNLGAAYERVIKQIVLGGKKGSINLVAYFLIRSLVTLRDTGTIGLIATDSITESDTRKVALAKVFETATLFRAISSFPWPGKAVVRVSLLCFAKGKWAGLTALDGKEVDSISTMLQSGVDFPEPHTLISNQGMCSDGVKVQGVGFVLDNMEALSLLSSTPEVSDVLTPYVVGDDINGDPRQTGNRWVINFWTREEEEARRYPAAWDIVWERVKPYRDSLTKQVHEPCFWKFWDRREVFHDRVRSHGQVLVASKLSKHFCVAFGDPNNIYSEKVKLFDFVGYSALAILQSAFHIHWALLWGSTTGETPAYVGTSCFDTFPFPQRVLKDGKITHDFYVPELDAIAMDYHRHRAEICAVRGEGFTSVYNRLHSPNESGRDFVRFRELTVALDHAVARIYRWTDIDLEHGFHDARYLADAVRTRFTISEAARVEVLRRLSALNRQRYEEELGKGLHKPRRKY